MEVTHVTYQTNTDGLRIQYDVCVPDDLSIAKYKKDSILTPEASNFEERIEIFMREYGETLDEIERLTNHADGLDYAMAVSSGVITGLIDAFFVGKWDFANAKAISNREVNEKVIEFAKKNGLVEWAKKNGKDADRLDSAIQFLERKYKLPGDGSYKPLKSLGVTDQAHHLDDFCHHPTIIGLFSCILVQFTGSTTYRTCGGVAIKVPVEVNQYGKFVSEKTWGKVFAGIINWFFNIAQIAQNRKGHFFSDMAGSSTSVGKGNEGAGLPGTFLSTAKELASLPCFKDTNFAKNLRKAYQNGIGDGKSQLDLGALNSLFEGASSKFDLRTEIAIGHELKRQAIPVIINEMVVRAAYFVRRFIQQMKEKKSVLDIEWKPLLPANNRTIVRMLTISTGTLTAIDLADAAVRAAVDSKGAAPAFLPCFILRVNFVGIGRTSIAIGSDAIMGIQKGRYELAAASAEVAMVAINEIKAVDQIETMQAETQKRLDEVTEEIDELSRIKL